MLRPRFAGGAAGNGPMVFDQGRPLQVWEIAKQLTRGIAFAKRLAGEVPSCLRDVPSWSCWERCVFLNLVGYADPEYQWSS